MSVHPMISALRKHKAGVILIVLQVALTLAIVCNAIFIIGARIERIARPTGLDEADLFLVTQQWVGLGASADNMERLDAMQREDLATLRGLPEVASVAPISSLPLLDSAAWNSAVDLKPNQANPTAKANVYFSDDAVLSTLGMRLLAGRAFEADDVGHRPFGDSAAPAVVIVSQDLADRLYPAGDAVGQGIYLDGNATASRIVGVASRLQTPGPNDYGAYYSVLVPARFNSTFSRYAVRARPGQREAAMKAASSALFRTNGQRVIADDGIQAYADIRQQAYRADIGMAMLMAGVSLILLGVTAAGIFGLTSFWVDQRKRQIGVRRALGARRRDILSYFQLENLLIVGAGAAVGVALAVALNLLLISRYEMTRLPVAYVLLGVVLVISLSQLSTFIPARKAAKVEPASAIRSM